MFEEVGNSEKLRARGGNRYKLSRLVLVTRHGSTYTLVVLLLLWMAGPRGDGDGGWWRRSHCQGTLCLTAAAGWEVAGSREWRPRSILRPLALAPGTASAQLLPVWHPGPTPATLSPGTGQEWSPETLNTPPRLEWLVYCLRCD